MIRVLSAYLAAVIVAYVGASIAQTQSVMARLADMGVPVSVGVRLEATAHDVVGLATSLLPLIAVGLAIALPVAALAIRVLPGWRPVGYVLAGGAALLAIHVALNLSLGIHPVAATRTTIGLTAQALCGGLGGWVFLQCLPERRP
ncbi:MAG: hypothetical protein RIC56_05795 [Pseudomonadales bacterium]